MIIINFKTSILLKLWNRRNNMTNKPMLIRIAPILRTQAEEMAKEKGMTLSEWVRHMIVREIEANKK
jgi:predicted HicB family RNase H-like nuclease